MRPVRRRVQERLPAEAAYRDDPQGKGLYIYDALSFFGMFGPPLPFLRTDSLSFPAFYPLFEYCYKPHRKGHYYDSRCVLIDRKKNCPMRTQRES